MAKLMICEIRLRQLTPNWREISWMTFSPSGLAAANNKNFIIFGMESWRGRRLPRLDHLAR